MNEAKYLMKNYRDRGGCYPSRPYAEADNTLRDLRLMAFLYLRKHYPTGRTWANIYSSSGSASQVYHKTHYASGRTFLRNTS